MGWVSGGVLIAAVTVLTRIWFLGNISEDEAFFTLIGRNWLDGQVPYQTAFDVKPPGLFALVAAAVAAFGRTILAIKLLEIISVLAGAWLVYAFAARFASRRVALLAGCLFPLYAILLQGTNLPAILIQGPFVIAAFLAVTTARTDPSRACRLAFVAGLAIGAAGMIKQTAIFECLGLALLLVMGTRPAVSARRIVLFGLSAAAVPVAISLYFASHHAFWDMFDASVLSAVRRTAGDLLYPPDGPPRQIGYGEAALRLLIVIPPYLPALMLTLLLFLRINRDATDPDRPVGRILAVWLATGLVGIFAARSLYDNYGHALIAPLVTASAMQIDWYWRRGTHGYRLAAIAAALLVSLLAVYLDRERLVEQGTDVAGVKRAAEVVRARSGGDMPTLLVVNRGLLTFVEAPARPAGRHFYPLHMLCAFPGGAEDLLNQALDAAPRFVVVADRSIGMVCEQAERHAYLDSVLGAKYEKVAEVRGDRYPFSVYELRP